MYLKFFLSLGIICGSGILSGVSSSSLQESSGNNYPSKPYPYVNGDGSSYVADNALVENEYYEDEEDNADKRAFVQLINKILWNSDDDGGESGRGLRRHGILNRKIPNVLRSRRSLPGKFYHAFTDQCYSVACRFGLSRFARSINEIIG